MQRAQSERSLRSGSLRSGSKGLGFDRSGGLNRRESGSMLIIALAVLTLLSIIAVTFAALMRLERKATENFVNSASVELLSGSGESAVIAMLRSAPLWDGYTDGSSKQRTPWLYGIQTPFGDIRYGNQIPLETLTDPSHSSYSSDLGATYGGTASSDRFLTKIIDCNSQIYLNGDQDTTAQMLDNLGLAIQKNTDIQIDPPPHRAADEGEENHGARHHSLSDPASRSTLHIEEPAQGADRDRELRDLGGFRHRTCVGESVHLPRRRARANSGRG